MQRRFRIGLIVFAVAIILIGLSLYFWRKRHGTLDYSGTIETREIQIGSKVGGRVTTVGVEEGQNITAGTLLVRFECNELLAQRAQAEAEIDQSQATLDRLIHGNRPEEIQQADATASAAKAALEEARNGPRKEEISQARADYEAAEADALNAESTYQRMAKLVSADTISKMDFDGYRDKRDSAKQKAESAQQKLALLLAGTRTEDIQSALDRYNQAEAAAVLARKGARTEDIALARGQLAASQAHLSDLNVNLRECELDAPADGVVEVVSLRPGDLVPAGRIVISMLEPSQLWVKVYVPETDLARVHLGQVAAVSVDMRGISFTGRVGEIDSEAQFLPRNVQTPDDRQHQVFGVKVYVNNAGATLKSGMSATVHLQ